jgi:hypothetical protein
MIKFIVPFAAAVLVLSTGLASADEASGKIQSIEGSTITLESGEQFTISDGTAMEQLEAGTEVTVSYEEQGDEKVATEVLPKAQ